MLNKNATLTPNSCDFYDLRNFVAKFCHQNLRTFFADCFRLKNWIPQTLSFFGCMCISLFDFLGNVDIPSFIVHPKIRQPGEFSVQFILIISTSSSTIMKLSAIALVAIMAFSSTSALPTCEECVFAMGWFLHLVCPPFTLHQPIQLGCEIQIKKGTEEGSLPLMLFSFSCQ